MERCHPPVTTPATVGSSVPVLFLVSSGSFSICYDFGLWKQCIVEYQILNIKLFMQMMRNVSLKDRKVEGDQNEATIIYLKIPLSCLITKNYGTKKITTGAIILVVVV